MAPTVTAHKPALRELHSDTNHPLVPLLALVDTLLDMARHEGYERPALALGTVLDASQLLAAERGTQRARAELSAVLTALTRGGAR